MNEMNASQILFLRHVYDAHTHTQPPTQPLIHFILIHILWWSWSCCAHPWPTQPTSTAVSQHFLCLYKRSRAEIKKSTLSRAAAIRKTLLWSGKYWHVQNYSEIVYNCTSIMIWWWMMMTMNTNMMSNVPNYYLIKLNFINNQSQLIRMIIVY